MRLHHIRFAELRLQVADDAYMVSMKTPGGGRRSVLPSQQLNLLTPRDYRARADSTGG